METLDRWRWLLKRNVREGPLVEAAKKGVEGRVREEDMVEREREEEEEEEGEGVRK